ncbi:MAG: hypothetical protein L0I11_09115, partial [Lactococcus lactis]|nr:hypothetical protein [Lactococcus lactis]
VYLRGKCVTRQTVCVYQDLDYIICRLFPNVLNIDCPGVSQQLINCFDFFAGFGHLKSSYPVFPAQLSSIWPLKAPIFTSKRF